MNSTSRTKISSIPKSSSIARNISYKNNDDVNLQNRTQNNNKPWDEGSFVREDVQDDEKGFQFQSSRQYIVEDNYVRGLHSHARTKVKK